MKERPILFSAPMVRALLAGTKTQTRRVVKGHALDLLAPGMFDPEYVAMPENSLCPYGAPGDRLWVKEQTLKVEDAGWVGPVYTESDAGRQALEWGYGEPDDPDHIPPHAIKRRPSMFMSRAMSRITLEITDVRVERLQEISEADAAAEGAEEAPLPMGLMYSQAAVMRTRYREGFGRLWCAINGAASWDANSWVWVVAFKRLEG